MIGRNAEPDAKKLPAKGRAARKLGGGPKCVLSWKATFLVDLEELTHSMRMRCLGQKPSDRSYGFKMTDHGTAVT